VEDPRITNSPAVAIARARTPSSHPDRVGTLAGGVPGARVVVGLGDAVAVAVVVGLGDAVDVGVGVAVTVAVAVGVGVGPCTPTVSPFMGVCIVRLPTREAAPVERLTV
jgi:hypothetical protein